MHRRRLRTILAYSLSNCFVLVLLVHFAAITAACCDLDLITIGEGSYLGHLYTGSAKKPAPSMIDRHIGDGEIRVSVSADIVKIEYQDQDSGEWIAVEYDVVDVGAY